MSFRNGDKAREGRLRKAKIARRLRMEELKKTLTAASPSTPAAPPAKPTA